MWVEVEAKSANWKSYNQALVNRGSLTVWVEQAVIQGWYSNKHHGRRGRGFQFSNCAIETVLMLKMLFNLPLRGLEGFINSLFQLPQVPLRSPDYSSISRRAKTVSVSYRPLSKGPVAHVVIDATGLKVFGAGGWHQKMYGLEKHCSWRKLHIAVDAISHEIIAAQASVNSVADNEVLPMLVNPLHRQSLQVSANGAYDTRSCDEALQRKGVKISIPPRKNGVL